eukprot:CAMPEP_0113627576 /NCGR_PEP_ID=MMETSP0017_2-20120614/14284_1 /TAXON_ID=2856 /ORGANISM="Cylindrotheca closterium" /LENGTH=626 /DNA_ID=CAMNT_0000537841 /DNA_START=43 /DNA_END=1923 /DNA_ORIENTATION=+ /assembly_acc=CAM_ASM_000147
MSGASKETQAIFLGVAAIAAAGLLYFAYSQPATETKKLPSGDDDVVSKRSQETSKTSNVKKPVESTTGESKMDDKALHAAIEELDKKGKAYFKNKQFLQAAKAFTEALALIEAQADHSNPTQTSSLNRQIITLINNRSAMYEKGSVPELALEDCNKILEAYDMTHTKARTRKLRLLESSNMFYPALVEVCALQLLFMQKHRDTLRMGLPPSTQPPVPQSKLEELITKILPEQMDSYAKIAEEKKKEMLPSDYTLLQLLKSYTGYNSWMAQAAKDGSVQQLEKELEGLPQSEEATAIADRASKLMRTGRRHVYDGKYSDARETLLAAYKLVEGKTEVQKVMSGDDYARLLEWTGMVMHWTYELEGASQCYQECSDLEPLNAEIVVKQAGVAMDGGNQDEALKLFEKALSIDSEAADALLHRANLRMLQANLVEAEKDLERCLEIRPNHVLAHLRLAAVLTSKNDPAGAKRHLKKAESIDPNSSEVQSYRGELLFTQNEFAEAKEQFEKAMKLEPKNPTPYVNAALAELNTPPQPGMQMEMAQEACRLLEEAIKADPQFQAAYVQLGQLKLGMAADLDSARAVIKLYDQGLTYCRTKDEMKDLCSMKLLTQAQVDAATMLKMETFSMQ